MCISAADTTHLYVPAFVTVEFKITLHTTANVYVSSEILLRHLHSEKHIILLLITLFLLSIYIIVRILYRFLLKLYIL